MRARAKGHAAAAAALCPIRLYDGIAERRRRALQHQQAAAPVGPCAAPPGALASQVRLASVRLWFEPHMSDAPVIDNSHNLDTGLCHAI